MNTSPIITHALIEGRQRELLAQARQARLVREARQARLARKAELAAQAPAVAPARRFRLTLRLPALWGAH
jgi:hypothetical protein